MAVRPRCGNGPNPPRTNSMNENESTTEIRAFATQEHWLPLDQRWGAVVKIGSKRFSAYGATRDAAVENLRIKLNKAGAGDADLRD